MMQKTDNLRIKELRALLLPSLLIEELPITEKIAALVHQTRLNISDIIHNRDRRLLVIVGPCSIHDPVAAIEYASLLKRCADRFADDLLIVMRVYFEKPRTTVGWKGLINDPNLDSSFDINQGLRIARRLLLDINHLGVPTGSEFLDTIIPQYISDLTAWSAIGARTTESQIHRELASGLSMPLGFKNSTSGNVQVAIDAVMAAEQPHHFLGVSKQGIAAIVSTTGNQDCHVILRGSSHHTNYDAKSIAAVVEKLKEKHLNPRVMVDCSHGNSGKDHRKQIHVIEDIISQIKEKDHAILGIMIESHLMEGSQQLSPNAPLKYGQSITDSCICFKDTEMLLEKLARSVNHNRHSSR